METGVNQLGFISFLLAECPPVFMARSKGGGQAGDAGVHAVWRGPPLLASPSSSWVVDQTGPSLYQVDPFGRLLGMEKPSTIGERKT